MGDDTTAEDAGSAYIFVRESEYLLRQADKVVDPESQLSNRLGIHLDGANETVTCQGAPPRALLPSLAHAGCLLPAGSDWRRGLGYV